jgi:hypothetical protein
MASEAGNIEWLVGRTPKYCLAKDDIGEMVEGFNDVAKLGHGFSVVDELDEIDLRDGVVHWPTYVNRNLICEQNEEVHELLKGFVSCFAWEYTKMAGLNRSLVEHKLPIKQGFRPYKQPTRNYIPKIIGRVKEEVDRLLKARFIQPC